MGEWKVKQKKVIYKSKFFKVREQEITFPSGKKKTYDFAERVPTVIVFPITSAYELYLISEYRTLHKKRVIEAVAGHIGKGETPLIAAKRELKEESGISAFKWNQLAQIESAGSIIKSTFTLFLARDLKIGSPDTEEDEDIVLFKIPLGEAVKKVIARQINISSAVIGILLIDKLRKEGKL